MGHAKNGCRTMLQIAVEIAAETLLCSDVAITVGYAEVFSAADAVPPGSTCSGVVLPAPPPLPPRRHRRLPRDPERLRTGLRKCPRFGLAMHVCRSMVYRFPDNFERYVFLNSTQSLCGVNEKKKMTKNKNQKLTSKKED